MAVTLGNTNSNNGNISSISWAWTRNAGSSLIVFGAALPNGGNLSNVQYDGNVMSLARRETNTGASVAEIWYYAGATTSGNITATVSSKQKMGYWAADFGGVAAGASGISDANGTSADAATSTSVTVSNTRSVDYLFDVMAHNTGTSGYTAPDQTIIMNGSGGGDSYLGSYQPGSSGGVMDWSWTTTTDYAIAAVRIVSAVGEEAKYYLIT